MQTILDRIRELKTQAKNLRDLDELGLERYAMASKALGESIELASKALDAPETRMQAASELTDCYGLLGGIQRRWALESGVPQQRDAHLLESIRAYDAGFKIETGNFGVVNSYGLVNRLVSRLLLRPAAIQGGLMEAEGIEPVDVRLALEQARRQIIEQLDGPRRSDYWAAADRALLDLLLEKTRDPVRAYALFNAKSPPDYACTSVLDVLRPLSETDLPMKDALGAAVRYLQERLAGLKAASKAR